MKRLFWALLRWGSALLVALALGLFGAYQKYVLAEPGPEFTREAVEAIIAQESPVFYRDGVTPMGVFFDQEHRNYVPYADLPRDWVNAIVAAEDGNFFQHPGVDPKHILRAAWQNIKAGAVVAGGSTLTQQTAKNLFYRPDRSLRSKGVELVNAARLEAHFSKEDILEFYANQFHVSANGRGIGIAARYFFDKTPQALSPKECAFIAGMVKAPSRYNPFIGQTDERRAAARALAENRTAYVVRRMVEEGYLPAARAEAMLATPLDFRRGAFRYDRSVVLDEVQRRLEEPEFIELFERAGIDNPSTAGLRIVTTVDHRAQAAATYGLWHHLSELGPSLERPPLASLLLPETTSAEASPNQALLPRSFHVARLVSATSSAVTLDLGGRPCTVDGDGVARMAKALHADAGQLVAALPAGRFVLASVRADGTACDLELRPALQGAVIVLESGLVRALVGGNDNRNFNRASTAQRQFGSTWKTLVFYAAIQLGWLPADVLDNRRAVFPFRGVWYYPRADHASDPYLSMAAAGARSENIASVWLLAHLTDRLTEDQVRQVAASVDLTPRAGETTADYAVRMRDEAVIRASGDDLDLLAFTGARLDVLGEIAASPHPEDVLAVRSMLFGTGVAAEVARVDRTARSAEREARLAALDNHFLGLEASARRCLESAVGTLTWDPVTGATACGRPPAGFVPIPVGEAGLSGEETVGEALSLDAQGALVIEARVHLSTLRLLRGALDRRLGELAGREPYDPELLALHPDWRTLVGVKYLVKLARELGVTADLPENLTLPLGAADATLVEMAGMYQGLLKGERQRFTGEGYESGAVMGLRSAFSLPPSDEPTAIIQEVRDAGGNVIFRLGAVTETITDPRAGELVGGILRDVVTHGTGRRAAVAVALGGKPVPLAGKTGTTNDYRNAAFVGFAPVFLPGSGAPRWGSAVTVAAYVGYDDNRSMRRGSLRVQGASGALPAWLGTVEGLAQAGLLGPGGSDEYLVGPGLERVERAAGTGLQGTGMPVLTLPGQPTERLFAPIGAVAVATGTSVEAFPSGALSLPTDVEYGPPEPEEGVDPSVAPPPEPTPAPEAVPG